MKTNQTKCKNAQSMAFFSPQFSLNHISKLPLKLENDQQLVVCSNIHAAFGTGQSVQNAQLHLLSQKQQ